MSESETPKARPPSLASGGAPRPGRLSAVEALAGFDGPPPAFLANLIAMQGAMVGADQGVVLRFAPESGPQLTASYNPQRDQLPPSWLGAAAKHAPRVFATPGTTLLEARSGEAATGWLLLLALPAAVSLDPGAGRFMSALCVTGDDRAAAERAARELGSTVAVVKAYDARCEAGRRQDGIDRLTESIDLLAALGASRRFREAAMTLCNEVASRHHAHRVSLGWSPRGSRGPSGGVATSGGGGGVKLVAMSRTERVNRRMKLVQDLEAAMEETHDQDTEVAWPSPPELPVVSRDHAALTKSHGSSHVVSLPLRHGTAGVVAVLVVEWSAVDGRPETTPGPDVIERLRLLAELATPLLAELHDRDRWLPVKARDAARRGLGHVLGSEYTWAKLAAVALLAAGLWMTLARGTDYVKSTFVTEATERQLVTAPFAGYLDAVHVGPGDRVEAGVSVLAELDTAELRLEAARLSAEEASLRQRAERARGERDMAGVRVALAEAAAVAAQGDLVRSQIEQASLRSGLAGVVVRGDLKRQLGRAVSEGETLFEVAPLDALRAELYVPEARAGEVTPGMRGELATTTYPDQRVGFRVVRIEPAARVEQGRNVFAVEVELDRQPGWMRPGMTGAARITAGEDRYLTLWTRDAVNWLRMKLWL
ncbi:MAG: HlyD family efflux transporter periplasmic adaptor subunit [Planctomycetota bacterium]